MSRVLTARTSSAEQAAREALETGLADVKLTPKQLGGIVERSETKVVQWLGGTAHTPLYLLAHALVPEGLRARLRAIAPANSVLVPPPVETTSALLVSDVGATLHSLGAALSDGKVSPEERRVLAPLVRQLRARCDQWLARHAPGEEL